MDVLSDDETVSSMTVVNTDDSDRPGISLNEVANLLARLSECSFLNCFYFRSDQVFRLESDTLSGSGSWSSRVRGHDSWSVRPPSTVGTVDSSHCTVDSLY
jgi:hypothetical protein